MKKVRYGIFAYILIFTFLLSACAAPTPVVIVVTATSLPPTAVPPTDASAAVQPSPAPALVSVPVSGPKSGTTMKWIDGSTLAYVPPGEFTMGNAGFDAPVRSVTLDGYWMYQTNVTNRMFAQCVAVGACTAPAQELGGPVYSNPEYANHPVIGVTWDQAQAYCTWSQGQLPTEAQWEKAARGPSRNAYPWGNEKPACDLLNLGYCTGRTTEVNAFPSGVSAYGLFDMAGNIFEWVSDWYAQDYYKNAPTTNPTGPDSGQYRSIRGSSFETDFNQAESALRHFGAQAYHHYDLGFRCAIPQPKQFAPFCQLAAFVPTGVIVSNGCQLPVTNVAGQYCSAGNGYATVSLPADAVYEPSKKLKCEEAVVDGQRLLTCLGPKLKETTNEVTVCNPTCSNSPSITGAVPTCGPGYTLDPSTSQCNYSPIIGQVGVAGCPVGYTLADNGGQKTCVVGKDANGQCPSGLYFDDLAQRCVAPDGSLAPVGLDNPGLASKSYAGCATGYAYSDTFQCCQAVSGGTYPGCSPGTTYNKDLGACSPGAIRLAGPGCVTLDVTTLQCSQPVDTCAPIQNETRCIHNPACQWHEAPRSNPSASYCAIRK
jgi:formylglycine-generating enzyme required for sulfatase activity